MKTAARFCVAASLAMFGAGFGFVPSAYAEDALGVESNSVSAPAPGPAVADSLPGPAVTPPEAADPPALGNPISSTSINLPVSAPEAAKIGETAEPKKALTKAKKGRGIGRNIPESVDEAIDKLDNSTEDITLDDLNKAREAVVKLDVLIDIEKRLNDLAKLRQDKMSAAVAPVAAALPASALGAGSSDLILPTAPPAMPASSYMPPESHAPKGLSSSIEVNRISGAAGHYTALIRDGQKTKSVREGDKLSDGTVVVGISRDGVTLSKDKERKTVQVRDVAQIFNGR